MKFLTRKITTILTDNKAENFTAAKTAHPQPTDNRPKRKKTSGYPKTE